MWMQSERILEMDTELMAKRERTNTLRKQFQETKNHLAGMVRQVRDRTEGILTEYEVLIEEVVGENLKDREDQGGEVPRVEGEAKPLEVMGPLAQ